MERRGNIDYLAGRLFQFFIGRAADVECALGINIYDGPKAVWRQFACGTKKIAGSSIDDNIDPAVMLDRPGDRILDFGKIANVAGDRETLAAIVVDDLLHRHEILDLAARYRKLGAVLRESPGHAARNTRSAAGYKRNFTL